MRQLIGPASQGFSKIKNVKLLGWCLAHGKCSINVNLTVMILNIHSNLQNCMISLDRQPNNNPFLFGHNSKEDRSLKNSLPFKPVQIFLD